MGRLSIGLLAGVLIAGAAVNADPKPQPPSYQITGYVKDRENKPVESMRVRAFREGVLIKDRDAKTNGHYEVGFHQRDQPVTLVLTHWKKNYAPMKLPGLSDRRTHEIWPVMKANAEPDTPDAQLEALSAMEYAAFSLIRHSKTKNEDVRKNLVEFAEEMQETLNRWRSGEVIVRDVFLRGWISTRKKRVANLLSKALADTRGERGPPLLKLVLACNPLRPKDGACSMDIVVRKSGKVLYTRTGWGFGVAWPSRRQRTTGTSEPVAFRVRGDYEVSVRARNCGRFEAEWWIRIQDERGAVLAESGKVRRDWAQEQTFHLRIN